MRRLLAALTIPAIVLALVAPAGSNDTYNGFKMVALSVNGKPLQGTVPAISMSGTVMSPVGSLAEALGAKAEVKSDGHVEVTSTRITELERQLERTRADLDAANKKLQAANPPLPEVGRSRLNPVPSGSELLAPLAQDELNFAARFKVITIVRGDAAWKQILDANQFNSPADPGLEYIVVRMSAELTGISDAEASITFDSRWWTAVSSDGRDYPSKIVVPPRPEYGGRLYKGARSEGWLVFQVSPNDSAPLLATARDAQGKSGYWLSLKSTSGNSSTSTSPSAPPSQPTSMTTSKPIKTPAELAEHLNENYGTVATSLGTLKLTYEITSNDTTIFPFDYWIRMRFSPTTFFFDLQYKNTVSETDRQATLEQLRSHAKAVYKAASSAFPGKKVRGQYYDSWYEYPTIQVGFKTRQYLTWQNYNDNLGGASTNFYANATLTEFHFEPRWDDAKW